MTRAKPSNRWYATRVARRTPRRGFTMVELMTVVVIVGILSTVAVFGVMRYIASAKSAEALAMVNTIRAAEEAYRDETFVYHGLTNWNVWHPTAPSALGNKKANWHVGSGNDMTRIFRELGVETNNPVYFTYAVVAGTAGGALPAAPCDKSFNFPAELSEPAYIVAATGDLDGDRTYSYVVSHSFSGEIYVEREGE